MAEVVDVRVVEVDARWATKQEACAYLRISLPTLDRWIREGRVTVYKIDGLQSVRLSLEELDALMVPAQREHP